MYCQTVWFRESRQGRVCTSSTQMELLKIIFHLRLLQSPDAEPTSMGGVEEAGCMLSLLSPGLLGYSTVVAHPV